jgi:hypothetical protein
MGWDIKWNNHPANPERADQLFEFWGINCYIRIRGIQVGTKTFMFDYYLDDLESARDLKEKNRK